MYLWGCSNGAGYLSLEVKLNSLTQCLIQSDKETNFSFIRLTFSLFKAESTILNKIEWPLVINIQNGRRLSLNENPLTQLKVCVCFSLTNIESSRLVYLFFSHKKYLGHFGDIANRNTALRLALSHWSRTLFVDYGWQNPARLPLNIFPIPVMRQVLKVSYQSKIKFCFEGVCLPRQKSVVYL